MQGRGERYGKFETPVVLASFPEGPEAGTLSGAELGEASRPVCLKDLEGAENRGKTLKPAVCGVRRFSAGEPIPGVGESSDDL